MSQLLQQERPVEARDVSQHIYDINTRGYSVIPNVISPEAADEVRSVLEEFLEAERQPRHIESRTQRVARIAVKHEIFRKLLCHPTIVSLWQEWLGDDVISSTWSANTIFPGFETLLWHADSPYWAMKSPWPAGNICGQTIWMLDDFTAENGGTGVVPYSQHKLYSPADQDKWRDDAEIVTGTRGSVAVLHGALWHTARSNQSDQDRSALLGMYCRPSIVTMEDMRGQLADIDEPSELLKQLMGANAYQSKDVVS